MRLLVDIGNTRLKWLALEAGLVIKRGHLLHRGISSEHWGDRLWRNLRHPELVVIANVAGPEIAAPLTDWVERHWAIKPHFVHSEASGFGINSGYDTPKQLGVDRWAAMIGSRQLLHHNSIIIDCGTAVTVDALSASGDHLGGIIMPGIRLMLESLYQKTSQITEQEMGDVEFLGTNTRDCVWGGTVHAIAAAIDRVSRHMGEVMPGETSRLLTGGNAEALLPYLELDYRLEPDLIFHGLRVLADDVAELSS